MIIYIYHTSLLTTIILLVTSESSMDQVRYQTSLKASSFANLNQKLTKIGNLQIWKIILQYQNVLFPFSSGDVVSQPFTAAETLVWDWQAVAVVSAAASCLVFFTVVAIYFVINARQWKKINKNYNKGNYFFRINIEMFLTKLRFLTISFFFIVCQKIILF